MSGKVTELKILNDSLHKENIAKDRELRKLNKDVQQYEQTILNLRNELSFSKYKTPEVSKKDAEVMAGMCCTASAECGDWRPVKEFREVMRDEMIDYQERIQKMEENLKSSTVDVASLRTANVTLREEARALRGACAALAAEARAAAQRANFKDDIIRELRAQLKRAKAQCKKSVELVNVMPCAQCPPTPTPTPTRLESVTIACVRRGRDLRGRLAQHTRKQGSHSDADDSRSPRLIISKEDIITNT